MRGFLQAIRIFTGFDQREAAGWHVFLQSVIERTDSPVEIIPLTERLGKKLGIATDGSNAFSKLRFAVPYLCGFKGSALFVDGADMLCLADIAQLWEIHDAWHGVRVVKHDYRTRHQTKYIGTELESVNEDYERKNWSSVIFWRCDYLPHQVLTPSFIAKQPGSYLHRFAWMQDERIGDLPAEWNSLILEQEAKDAKLAHFTLGIPGFEHYGDCEHSDTWKRTMQNALQGMQYDIVLKR